MLLNPIRSCQSQPSQNNESTHYLESGTLPIAPRIFWRDNQHRFPALARLSRDVLSIPATGAGW
ncbi:hypothetical protein AFLA70_13g006361 [Aspergillus flavus AF70]|nr:hypothetical protein AFLA70_13g006361 [Aspergillus flavus AF70]